MLADRVGDAFRLDLLAPGRQTFLPWLFLLMGMKLLVGHLMDQGLDRLHFTHAFLQGDPLLGRVIIPFGSGFDLFKADRYRTDVFQCGQQPAVTVHPAGKLIHAQRRKFLSFCLTDIKNRCDPEGRIFDLNGFRDRFTLRVQLRSAGCRIQDFPFLLCLVGRRCDDLDSLFSLLHMTLVLFLPGLITGDQCGVRLLHGDQQRIVQGVIVELGHRGKVSLVGLALKQGGDAGFQLIGDGFDPVGSAFAFSF